MVEYVSEDEIEFVVSDDNDSVDDEKPRMCDIRNREIRLDKGGRAERDVTMDHAPKHTVDNGAQVEGGMKRKNMQKAGRYNVRFNYDTEQTDKLRRRRRLSERYF